MLRILGSTWFAITLLVLIFLYSSVGSAVPPVRQGAMADWFGWEALRFEMTEMQWFCSPVFVGLVGLFSLSMVVATIRRIPLNMARLGEWIVHAGVLVMVIGCFIYFGRKIEGDAVIYQRAALITAPGVSTPVKMIVRPGANVTVGAGNDPYRISVARIAPRYEVPSGPDKGKQTMAVWFGVQRPGATPPQRFTRVALVGYPSLSEDVAGSGTTAKPSGAGLLDTNLRIDLDYEPQDSFFLEHTAALYARFDPHGDWVEMPIRKLPRYYEHVPNDTDIWADADGQLPPVRPIDIEAGPGRTTSSASTPQTLAGIKFRAVGYLPYAQLDSAYTGGGKQLNPVVRFSLADGAGQRSYELVAFDPMRNHMVSGDSRFRVEFCWAGSAAERNQLAVRHNPRLEFRVAGRDSPIELPLTAVLDKGPQTVPGTDYKVTVGSADVMLNFPLMSEALRGKSDDVAIVSVEHGDKKFRRLVFSQYTDQSRDLSETHTPLPELVDRDLQIRFVDPAPAGIWLIGGPTEKDCEVVLNTLDGEQTRQPLPVGQAVAKGQTPPPLMIDALIPQAVQTTRPLLVPRNQRQPLQSVGAAMSLLAVQVDDGTTKQQVWLPFNRYAFPNATYAYPERFQYGSYATKNVTLSDGRTLELMYSRERRYLPAAIALDRFVLETLPGGQRERDFISVVRFYEKDHWSPAREIRSNQPGEYGGLWFFQSEWDPKHEVMTVLGVGNREGIGTMLTGVILSILGMMYSFYVKPTVVRRRMEADMAALADEPGKAPKAATTTGASAASPKKRRPSTPSRIGIIAALAALLAAGRIARAEPPAFAHDVDLSQIRLIAVQHDGRVKPFDTLARETIQQITGKIFFDGQDPVFTYLDLMLNPSAYTGRNLILVKKARVREGLIKAAGSDITEAEGSYIRQTKRVSQRFLALPGVQQELDALESDTMNTGRDVDLIHTAQAYADPRNLRGFLAIVPPPGGTPHSPWLGADELAGGSNAMAAVAPALREKLTSSWKQLETAWPAQDAKTANTAMNALAVALPKVAPRLYPERPRLVMEHRYFEYKAFTGVWMLYLAAFVCLLPAFLARTNVARRIGMLAFLVAFAMQTVSIGIRWYLARRIPMANMFEAVTGAAWFAAAGAWVLEVWLRRRPMRNLFALGASFFAALVLVAGYYMPNLLSANISNPMPILNTVWLKIHVSLIVFSYAAISVSFVTAALYLALRAVARLSGSAHLHEMWAGAAKDSTGKDAPAPLPDADTTPGMPFGLGMSETGGGAGAAVCCAARPAGTITWAILCAAGVLALALLLKGEIAQSAGAIRTAASLGAAIGHGLYVLLLAATIALGPAFVIWLATGTARILFARDDAVPRGLRAPLAAVLDGSTMLLIEGAFVTLWVGIILGAAWADVSWGRPWGWDPKEVFALNTWLIFVGLIHIRLNVRDKGLWTAILAVAGFLVMMFNWIGVNYFIVGLHSYA